MLRRLCAFALIVLVLTSPAAAHKLKVFASVAGSEITSYGFFIGGGRAQDTEWVAKDGDGKVIAEGVTDADGSFRLNAPTPVISDIIVTLNTREGHIASATLAAARFGVASVTAVAPAPQAPEASPAAGLDAPATSETAALVEAAVQRQVAPLLERIEEMDSRLRYADILSGVFLIIGLAGIGLWARGRQKR